MPYAEYEPATVEDLEGRNFATVTEAASILELDPRTVLSAIKRGEIPATKVGQVYRIPTAWLRTAAAGQPAGAGAGAA
jgi:excisionase family DNA binding protein